jgi:ABC-type uncharacterized transport system ATPase subunit
VKTLYRGAEILLLDEPTAVLTRRSRRAVRHGARDDAAGKRSFISHKLEVMDVPIASL